MVSLRRMPNLRHPQMRHWCPLTFPLQNRNASEVLIVNGYFSVLSSAKRWTRALGNAAAVFAILVCTAVLLSVPCASLARDAGYISGTVEDKSGAAVAGADVTVTSTTGNLTRTTTTNADGAYTVAGLPGGHTNLSVRPNS